jgi:protein TonB
MDMTDTPLEAETESDVPTPPQSIAARPAETAAASVETASEDSAEVAALADEMVDALTSTEEIAASPPSTIVTHETRVDETPKGESEIDVEALAESMAKQVDLPRSAAPVATPAAHTAEDEDEDIETLAEHRVDGITASQTAEPDDKAPPELEIDATALDEPQMEPEETVAATDEVDLRLDDLLVEDDPVVATEQDSSTAPNGDAVPGVSEEPVAPVAVAEATATTQPKPREVTIPWSETPKPVKSRGTRRLPWKPLAAVAFIGAVAFGAWIFVSRNEPAVEELKIAGGLGAILEQAAQAPVAEEPSPAGEEPIDATEAALVASEPETVAVKPEPAPSRPKRAATTARPEPVPPRPAAARPGPEPVEPERASTKPEPAAVTPIAVTAKPKPTATAPVPTPVTPSPTATTPTPAAEPAAAKPGPAATTPSPPPAIPEPTATAPRPASNEPQPATPLPEPVAAAREIPVPAGPAEPETIVHAPQLVSRLEPVYPAKARKRGEGGLIVLKVLVNDRGRVVRVVVDEGLPGSELEARAIDAALRSSYEPATENGRPVQAWVVERFVFEP